ncbi:MAG: diguanylate cyclase [Gammaproteobacteria bacterium]|nr:MAG: diguanylate cyclase [Gammaproteobacteria bacterium]
MKLRHLLSALVLLPLPLQAADTPSTGDPSPQNEPAPEIVPLVRVGDFDLTNLHFSIFAAQRGADSVNTPEKQVRLLNELVNTFIVANSPRGRALAQEPELKAAMEVANARLLAQAVIGDYLKHVEVSDDEIQKAYRERYANADNREYKARHILVKSEQAARELIAKLEQGADFDKLAREHSTGPSKSVGGDLGWFTPDTMVKPFAEAVMALKDGEYTRDPVQTRFGWHVILREQSRPVPVPKLDDVRGELVKEIKEEKLADYIRGMRAQTLVEVVGGQKKTDE